MNLKPLEDRIVVRPGESEETTVSGIVIPDTAKEKPQQGEVLAVGPGRRSEQSGELIPVDVKVGDTVVYSKYGGTEITVEGEDLLILTGRDVLAIVDATKASKAKKSKKATPGQKEMLMPIAGKKPAKEAATKKPAAKPQRKSA